MMNEPSTIDQPDNAWDLPRWLRGIGALVLIMSLSSFLFQGWNHVDDATQYLMLLAETILLCIAGVLSIKWLNEPRGARTFVALTLIAIPVNFAIMGGMIYAPYIAGTALADTIPHYLRWQATDMDNAMLIMAGSLPVLIPMIMVGYRIMARESARQLASIFIILNSALLLPVRTGLMMDIILISLAVLTLWQLHNMRQQDFSLQTPTGRFARASLLIPLGILFGRTLWIYGGDMFMTGVTGMVVFMIFRHLSAISDNDNAWRPIINLSSLIPAYVAISHIGAAVSGYVGLGDAVLIPLASMAYGLVLMDTSLRSNTPVAYQRLALLSAATGAIFSLLVFGTAFNVIWVMLTGIVMVVFATIVKQKSVFLLGIATTTTGLVHQLHSVFTHFDFSSWGAMAAIGILTILTASVIERHGNTIKARVSHSWKKVADWEF